MSEKPCATKGCNLPCLPKSSLCMLCAEKKKWLDSSHKAAERLDPMGNIVGFGMAWLFGKVQEKANNPNLYQENKWKNRTVRPSQDDVVGSFSMLGLDPKKAKEEDVRRVQKALSKIWHSDKGAGKAGEEKLKEINNAASICLKHLKKS